MDIHSIRKIIFPAVSDVVSKLEEENHNVKITLLREIFNEAINGALNISHTNNTSIKAMFSGRGRAWAKININENPVWGRIKFTLNQEINTSHENSTISKDCINMLDMFETAGFAWVRFVSSNKGNSVFQIRIKGSKLEDHIKLRIENYHLENGNIVNLEGVPHKLGLESGNFLQEKENLKKKLEVEEYIPLTEKSSNIISMEDLING